MPFYRVNGAMVHIKMTNTKKRPAPAPCHQTITIEGRACRCMGISTTLCDWPVDGGTCDTPMCAEHSHAHPTKADTDYCSRHWAKYRG